MKDFAGTPGTVTAFILRMSQCLFAAASVASMASSTTFSSFTAFCYLISSMGIQIIWSLGLACMDAYALAKKKVFLNPGLVSLFAVGDWVSLHNKKPFQKDCLTSYCNIDTGSSFVLGRHSSVVR